MTSRIPRMVLTVLLAGCSPAAAVPQIVLEDVTARSGVTFRHTDGAGGKRYIVETVCAGLALFDFDRDGDIDIYFLNGKPLGDSVAGPPPTDALYRNDGGLRFTDVTAVAGVGETGHGLGVAVGDYDNDGFPDIYVNNYGPNVLYRNNGDGTFSDVTQAAGVSNGNKVGAGTCFLDIEGDGDLDLYVANYVRFSPDTFVPRFDQGVPRYPGPVEFSPEPDDLYRNNGDGTFTNISAESGISSVAGTGMGIISCDYDDDGDSDVFVCNDAAANFLFQNDGTGRFDEVGLPAGVAFNVNGHANASMGVDCGDFNNDGLLDFFVTNHQDEVPVLYRNLGQGLFEDATLVTGAGAGTFKSVTWGTGFVDFDNDGHRDIFIACGHTDDTISQIDKTQTYEMRNVLLRNTGAGTFVNVSDVSGSGMQGRKVGRGTGFDDLDNDGDIDAVILNLRSEPTILENKSRNNRHWLQLQLRGTRTNRDAVGARVRVVAGDLKQIAEVHGGRGYQSHHGSRLHFGLGERDRVDRIEVRWLGGGIEQWTGVNVDRLLVLVEGSGETPSARTR